MTMVCVRAKEKETHQRETEAHDTATDLAGVSDSTPFSLSSCFKAKYEREDSEGETLM